MFSRNFIQYFYFFPLNCIVATFIVGIFAATASATNGRFEQSNIVFPAIFLQRQRSFEILTSSAVSTDSVIELSRAAEAFSLEYFQVKLILSCSALKHSKFIAFFFQ